MKSATVVYIYIYILCVYTYVGRSKMRAQTDVSIMFLKGLPNKGSPESRSAVDWSPKGCKHHNSATHTAYIRFCCSCHRKHGPAKVQRKAADCWSRHLISAHMILSQRHPLPDKCLSEDAILHVPCQFSGNDSWGFLCLRRSFVSQFTA